MSQAIEVRALSEAEHPAWEEFVAGSPGGSVYASPRYLGALAEVTGANTRVLAALRGGEILGGIALYERSSVAGAYLSPRLLLYYNGIVLATGRSRYPSEGTSLRIQVMQALAEEIRGRGYASAEFRARSPVTDVRPFLALGWTTTPSYSYVVSTKDIAEAERRMTGNFRRLVRRAEREGIELSSDEDFESFFDLHLEIHRRKGAPLYLERNAFRTYFERLRSENLCRLYHARLPDGTSAASQLVLLGPHPVAHTVCAGAREEHLKTGATVFLRWKACQALAEDGYEGCDLTDASLNPVTRFKSQLGGDLCLSLVITQRPTAMWRGRAAAMQTIELARRVGGAVKRRLPGVRRR